MKRMSICLIILALAWPGAGDVSPQERDEFRVVVHPDSPVTTLTRDALADIYFKRTTRWSDGTPVRPVDQIRTSSVREAFSRAVLERSANQMMAYWQQQIFSGRGVPPTEMSSDATVLEFVRDTPGSVGYVSMESDVRGVRIVELVR